MMQQILGDAGFGDSFNQGLENQVQLIQQIASGGSGPNPGLGNQAQLIQQITSGGAFGGSSDQGLGDQTQLIQQILGGGGFGGNGFGVDTNITDFGSSTAGASIDLSSL